MKRSKKPIAMAAGVVGLMLVMLYMVGVFRTGVIGPGEQVGQERPAPPPDRIGVAERREVPQWYQAVGTVRSREKATISAQISARVLKVLVEPGDTVAAGAPLVELDRRDLAARLDQAKAAVKRAEAEQKRATAGLTAARAGLAEALAQYRRIQSYFKQEAATKQQLEQTESRYRQAKAGVGQAQNAVTAADAAIQQAQQALAEAEVAFGYGLIKAPYAGQVAERLADPGDLAGPGKPLLTFQQPDALRFEADVREGLVDKVQLGAVMAVRIDAAALTLQGQVEELVPVADVTSRSFLVKVAIPSHAGLYPGMFGRLLVPLGKRPAVLAPTSAVRRVGQLTMVTAEVGGRWTVLYVKTGATYDSHIEILSGLHGTERLALE